MIVSMKYLIKYTECSKEDEFVDIENILPNTKDNFVEYTRQEIKRFEDDPVSSEDNSQSYDDGYDYSNYLINSKKFYNAKVPEN